MILKTSKISGEDNYTMVVSEAEQGVNQDKKKNNPVMAWP